VFLAGDVVRVGFASFGGRDVHWGSLGTLANRATIKRRGILGRKGHVEIGVGHFHLKDITTRKNERSVLVVSCEKV